MTLSDVINQEPSHEREPMLDPQLLDLYTDYLIASTSYTTATGLAELLDYRYSHDKITRFLNQEGSTPKRYWQLIKPTVRRIEHDNGVIDVDDTIEEKPYTDENEIVCWHFDHTSHSHVKGMNILNFMYHRVFDDGTEFSLPLAYEIIAKTETSVDKKTGKTKRKSPITKNALMRGRLKILVETNRVKFRYVLWDSWYSSADNLKFVKRTLHKDVVCALKANRNVALSADAKQAGQFVTVSALDMAPGTARLVYLKGVDFPVMLAKQILTNQDGSSGVLYLISTDTALTYTDITTLYKRRWKVETFHKSLKQNAALAKSPTKVERTQRNHIFAAMLAFVKLERLKLHTSLNHFALKHRLYLKALKTCLSELREFKEHAKSTIAVNFA
jgi:hypothetical protein